MIEAERDIPEHKRDETHSHYSDIQKIEPAPAKTSRMQYEPVRNNFKQTLNCKYSCKEVIKIVQYLKQKCDKNADNPMTLSSNLVSLRVRVEWVLHGEHHTGHQDAEKDQVPKIRMIAQPVTFQTKTGYKIQLI